MLGPIDPLTGCIDLRVGLNGRHHCRSRNVNLARSFDNLFQGRPDIALALREKPESVGVAIDTGAVCQPVFLGNGCWAFPRDELGLDLCQFRVATYRAVALVSAHIWFLLTSRHVGSHILHGAVEANTASAVVPAVFVAADF